MAGSLTGTPYRDDFFTYLRTKGGLTSDNSAKSYISYINNLCRNMAQHGTKDAGSDTAFDVLMVMAKSAVRDEDYLRALLRPLQGPKGRPQDLRSAAMQMFHFAKNHSKGSVGIPAAPKRVSAVSKENRTPVVISRNTDSTEKMGEFIFHKVHWLRNPPDEEVIKTVDELFELLATGAPGVLVNSKGRSFDEGIRELLIAAGCTSVSQLDTQRVLQGANYTFDITATTTEGIRLLIEIEKTEVKRIIHDILKIAAGQRRDPKSIGLIIVPDRYRTGDREFARTHLQEAMAMMELLDYSHSWGGQSIGVVVYEAR